MEKLDPIENKKIINDSRIGKTKEERQLEEDEIDNYRQLNLLRKMLPELLSWNYINEIEDMDLKSRSETINIIKDMFSISDEELI